MKQLSYPFRHRFFNFLLNKDIKGIRFLAEKLPKICLPHPSTVGQCILKSPLGIYLEINPSYDSGVEQALYWYGTYENGVLDFLQKNLNANDTFIDVGANIGLMSIYVSKLPQKVTTHAFEANPNTFEILKRNVQLNDSEEIVLHEIALGEKEGEGIIYEDQAQNRGGASLILDEQNTTNFKVAIKPLDSFQLNPKIIKIDVEGYELFVLKGAVETIKKYQPILIFEVQSFDTKYKNVVVEGKTIVEFIRNLGTYNFYKFKGSSARKSKLVFLEKDEDFPSFENIIAIPK